MRKLVIGILIVTAVFAMLGLTTAANGAVLYQDQSGWYFSNTYIDNGDGYLSIGDELVFSKYHDSITYGPSENGAIVIHSNNIYKTYEITYLEFDEDGQVVAMEWAKNPTQVVPHESYFNGYLYTDMQTVINSGNGGN